MKKNSIKILTWNIWYKENPKNIFSFLKSVDWDICCLQEVGSGFGSGEHSDVAKYLSSSFGVQSHYVEAQNWDKGRRTQGNMILSKLPIKDTFSCFIQEPGVNAETDFSDEGRVVVGIELDTPRKIKVLTIHMSYTHMFQGSKKREAESKQLLKYLESVDGEFILTGDLNTTSDSDLIRKLLIRYKNLSPDFVESTWTTKPFRYNDFEVDELKYRLDYIFGSSSIELIATKIISTEFSDHLPILSEIVVF